MKTILLLMVLFSSNAYCLTSDKFHCRMEIFEDLIKQTISTDKKFSIIRMPLSSLPSENIKMTASEYYEELSLNNQKSAITAGLRFSYKHAAKYDSQNSIMDARQSTCLLIDITYCDKNSCAAVTSACLTLDNPFDNENGWLSTGTFMGEPAFNENAITSKVQNIINNNGKKVGKVDLNCRFLGSFN